MAHSIDGDSCIGDSCKHCIPECPVDAITMAGWYYTVAVIDENSCTDCGACVDVCPAAAIQG